MKKFLENKAAEEINCQLSSKKSGNFPRNALLLVLFNNVNPEYCYF